MLYDLEFVPLYNFALPVSYDQKVNDRTLGSKVH